MSQAILNESHIGYSSQLAIFDKIKQNIGSKRSCVTTFYPINDTSSGLLQFCISNSSTRYLDLRSARLNLTCKITGPNGEPIYPTDIQTKINSSDSDSKSGTSENTASDVETDPKAAAADAAAAAAAEAAIAAADATTAKNDDNDDNYYYNTSVPLKIPTSAIRANIGIANNFAHSIWSRVDVSIQSKNFSQSDQSYAYMSYLKAMLYSNSDMKESAMQGALFYPDNASGVDDTNPLMTDNRGLQIRSTYFTQGQTVELSTPLHSDIFSINRFLPGSIEIGLTFHPNSPRFYLMSQDDKKIVENCKLVIIKSSLDIVLHEIEPAILLAHEQILKSHDAIFPYIRCEIKRIAMAKGLFEFSTDQPFSNFLPSEIVCGILKDSASHGNYKEDGLYFGHCNLASISVTVDNNHLINSPINTQYDDNAPCGGSYLQAYQSLAGVTGEEGVIPVSRLAYRKGHCLYRFISEALTDASHDASVIPVKRTGNVRITVRFHKPLESAYNLVLYGAFPAGLKLDSFKNVYQI